MDRLGGYGLFHVNHSRKIKTSECLCPSSRRDILRRIGKGFRDKGAPGEQLGLRFVSGINHEGTKQFWQVVQKDLISWDETQGWKF